MRNLDFKSTLIGFLGATIVGLSINATTVDATAGLVKYDMKVMEGNKIMKFNKITGEVTYDLYEGTMATEYVHLSGGIDTYVY